MEGKTTTKQTAQASSTPRSDVYERVTARIVADLEQGTRPWLKPWSAPTDDRLPSLPLRASGTPYRGVNVLLLWGAAFEGGYRSNVWMTYKQGADTALRASRRSARC